MESETASERQPSSPVVEARLPASIPNKRTFVRGKALGVKFRCLVVSDSFPHWLLALRPMDWTAIYWMQFGSLPLNLVPLLEQFLPSLKHSIVPIDFDALHFATLVASVDVLLVSGSEATWTQISSFKPSIPSLFIPNGPKVGIRRLTLTAGGLKPHRWRHRMLGGVTNGNLSVGSCHVDFSNFKPPLRRNIKHILDFSERPKTSEASPATRHYQATDVVRMNELALPVVYKSPHFCWTGWGSRKLSLKELACAFDLPSHCVAAITDTAFLAQLFPLKLLTEPLQHLLETLASGKQLKRTSKSSIPLKPRVTDGQELAQDAKDSIKQVAAQLAKLAAVPKIRTRQSTIPLLLNGLPNPAGPGVPGKRIWFRDPPGMTWLPELGKFLPDTWVDESVISEKAVKGDTDPVPEHLWSNRIQLVIPTASQLKGFQTFALMWQRRAMYRQLRRYLGLRHGSDWDTRLDSYRFLASRLATRAAGPPPRKRSRGGFSPQEHSLANPSVGPAEEERPLLAQVDIALHLDADAGCQVLNRYFGGEWWDWSAGSSLAFWRWNGEEQVSDARDGMRMFVKGELPRNTRPQRAPKPEDLKKMIKKLDKVLARGYISHALVVSLTSYFAVPKGDSDIRLVYDGSSSGLNDALWAPSFWMPTAETAVRVISFYSYLFDSDIGECFLNFPNDKKLRKHCGVDLSPFRGVLTSRPKFLFGLLWECWNRGFMGCKSSPYNSVRYLYLADEFCRGNRRDLKNPMRWDTVRLNLPGARSYDPRLPRVMKWCLRVCRIAGDICQFIDDERGSGHSLENAWQVHRQYISKQQYLGIQDAPRKTRPPSQDCCGAWAGTVIKITPDRITRSVTQAKWDKGRETVKWVRRHQEAGKGFPFKAFLSKKGFLVHLCMTYKFLTPFMKGFHLLTDSWREKRAKDGWKVKSREWEAYLQTARDTEEISETEYFEMLAQESGSKEAPSTVYSEEVLRFEDDLTALELFFDLEEPPLVSDRVSKLALVVYAFTDASGLGFGDTFLFDDDIEYTIGTWGVDEEVESSNYKELRNTVDAIERHGEQGKLSDSMLFFCTDNSTVENALFHGRSKESRKLHALVVRMKFLEAKFDFQLLVIHVAGERMQAQGTDGVSRGQLTEGVMNGHSMFAFLPMHETALERYPLLKVWIVDTIGHDLTFLSPDGWFERGHDHIGEGKIGWDGHWRPTLRTGKYVWTPAPAAALPALEELRKARIKRQHSSHIFVCPRVMTPEWLRQLHKAADVVVRMPVGHPAWPKEMFEPLLIGLVFPFVRHEPWQLRGTAKMYSLERQLRRLWKAEAYLEGSAVLRKFCQSCWGLGSMSPSMVSKMLRL
jgi:hypothetical protein